MATSPCAGLLPHTIGSVALAETLPRAMWSVAPFAGKEKAVTGALTAALSLTFPAPNRVVAATTARAIWAGRGLALIEADNLPDLTALAAVTDQSDAWAIVTVTGPDTDQVLARLVPIDLRRSVFDIGHTARTLVGHMTASVTRTGDDQVEIMAMRSMAGTLVHDLTRAADLFAGRPAS